METENGFADTVGHQCRLLRPVRDREGRIHFDERPRIIREFYNLGRRMFMVRLDDGTTMLLFPDEVALC